MLLGLWMSAPQHDGHDHLLTWADYVAYSVCHRLPSHSFTVFGRQMPFCARCTGIYLGILITLSTLYLTKRERNAAFPFGRTLVALAILFCLLAIDGTNSLLYDLGWFSLYQPSNLLRIITGFGCGIAVAIIISATFAQTAWLHPNWTAPIDNLRQLLLLILLMLPPLFIILRNQNNLSYVSSIASAVGLILILTMLYTTLVIIAIRRDGQFQQAVQLILPASIGFAFAIGQITVISILRFRLTGVWIGF